MSKWVPYHSDMAECEHLPSLGGWFGRDKKHSWPDYVHGMSPEAVECAESVRDAIAERWGTHPPGGFFHQGTNGETDGAPIAACGGMVTFSFRAWGDICAATVTYQDRKRHAYMEFAW